ncbi:MAG TPA: UDP-glucose 4-epimerase GalE [Caulobacteraceae bacterium]|nr:UDP-glucose 4-epimerase GalE [Caulobacteraceae bacterium]
MSGSVLVTGGAGYIGSHAVLAMAEAGYDPIVLDDLSTGVREAVPPGVAFFQGAAGDAVLIDEILDRHEIGAVAHFAGSILAPESIEAPRKYYLNNTVQTLALLDRCIEAGIPQFIFSSTAAVYGEPRTNRLSEEASTVPISPYGASKLFSERMLSDAAAAHPGFRPVCLRYFNVAGADEEGRAGQRGVRRTHLMAAAIDVALGLRPHLDIYGADYDTRDGTCERDYIHVSDLADAHVAALRYLEDDGEPAVMNCGAGAGYSVLEVVAALEAIIGRSLEVRWAGRRPGDPARLLADASEIHRRLAWRATRSGLPEILDSALRWRRDHPN